MYSKVKYCEVSKEFNLLIAIGAYRPRKVRVPERVQNTQHSL
jgi:hypothetical protein